METLGVFIEFPYNNTIEIFPTLFHTESYPFIIPFLNLNHEEVEVGEEDDGNEEEENNHMNQLRLPIKPLSFPSQSCETTETASLRMKRANKLKTWEVVSKIDAFEI